jgi:putative Ca2+/H+ antiporter (TMEM165/GDT1 family)
MKIFVTAFVTIFLAELGDKTQIATLLFAANKEHSKLFIFFGAALALICTTGIAILLGNVVSQFVSEKSLKMIGGAGFIIVGLWTIFSR